MMTEQEWLTSTDPAAMLEYLQWRDDNKIAVLRDRKLRLFAAECVRIAYDEAIKDRPEEPPDGQLLHLDH